MLCQKCNKNEANVKYTEIINGEKREMMLCEESFFGGLLEDEAYNDQEFMPLFQSVKELKCDNCNMTYDEFINQGKFGCPECYDVFSSKIDSLLKRLHGSNKYMGRRALNSTRQEEKHAEGNNIGDQQNKKSEKEETKLEKLQKDLKKAIAEERYEDAAKIRDEINNKRR